MAPLGGVGTELVVLPLLVEAESLLYINWRKRTDEAPPNQNLHLLLLARNTQKVTRWRFIDKTFIHFYIFRLLKRLQHSVHIYHSST